MKDKLPAWALRIAVGVLWALTAYFVKEGVVEFRKLRDDMVLMRERLSHMESDIHWLRRDNQRKESNGGTR